MSEALNLIYMPDGRVVNETGQDPAIPRVTGFSTYWVAADLGQANDYSAIVVIKDEALPIVDDGKVIVGRANERSSMRIGFVVCPTSMWWTT